jgi:hypothetical protein
MPGERLLLVERISSQKTAQNSLFAGRPRTNCSGPAARTPLMKIIFKVDTPRFLLEVAGHGRSFERRRVEARQICVGVDSAWPIEPVMRFSQWIAQLILGHAARGIAGWWRLPRSQWWNIGYSNSADEAVQPPNTCSSRKQTASTTSSR